LFVFFPENKLLSAREKLAWLCNANFLCMKHAWSSMK
jgi:hypothetical protein